MRISSVIGTNYAAFKTQKTSHAPNFKGILVSKGREQEDWNFWGQPSGSSRNDGHYQGTNDTYSYTYHPFKDESESQIARAIRENNYSSYEEGFNHFTTVYTDRGRTIPFTEKEYNNMSDREKKIIEIMI